MIAYTEFQRAHKVFENLKKSNLEFDIDVTSHYGEAPHYKTYHLLHPKFKRVNNVQELAAIYSINNAPLERSSFSTSADTLHRFFNSDSPDAKVVTTELAKTVGTVKFFSSVLTRELPRGTSPIQVQLLVLAPTETTAEGHTYRKVTFDQGASALAVNEDHPLYNYLDRGHALVTISNYDKGSHIFAVNNLTLDVNYLLLIAIFDPKILVAELTNKVFLDSAGARLILLKLERALKADFQPNYRRLKEQVLADFERNAQNVLVSKLMKKEVETIKLHDISIGVNKAEYETLSLEASDLMKVCFAKIDPNGLFDIYTMLEVYANHIENTLSAVGLNTEGTGFLKNTSVSISVNGYKVTASVCTSNTRRQINGNLINKDEIIPVLRRSACFETLAEYNAFVESVSSQSLDIHNILANGLAMKINPNGYTDYSQPDTDKCSCPQPRMFFKKVDKKYYLILNEAKDKTLELKRFVSFCDKIRVINRKTNGNYDYTTEGHIIKDGAWCIKNIKALIREFAAGDVNEKELSKITDKALEAFIEAMKNAQKKAEEVSEKLLQDVLKEVKAEKQTGWSKGSSGTGRTGYIVAGDKRKYFIDENSLQVFNADTGAYVCIVNGKGDQGVGKDGLVARLLAVSNDTVITKQIHTL